MQRPAFTNRNDAGTALAAALQDYAGRWPLILAIPRGAVPIGQTLARALGGELDVVLVRKLGAPFNAEFAVGAIDESGWRYVSPHAELAGASAHYLDEEAQRQLDVLRERRASYSPGRTRIALQNRTVIVVDDGLATGATMMAALHAARNEHPAELICALPVATKEGVALITPLADKVVCLQMPENFRSVGEWYQRFPQVSDAEVIDMLSRNTGTEK